jgi:hypothetical protein
MTAEAYPFAYIDPVCGKPAFYLKAFPNECEGPRSADALLPDGSKPEPHSALNCGSCGRVLTEIGQNGTDNIMASFTHLPSAQNGLMQPILRNVRTLPRSPFDTHPPVVADRIK